MKLQETRLTRHLCLFGTMGRVAVALEWSSDEDFSTSILERLKHLTIIPQQH